MSERCAVNNISKQKRCTDSKVLFKKLQMQQRENSKDAANGLYNAITIHFKSRKRSLSKYSVKLRKH